MSIFFDFDVNPNGRMFRRAVEGDKSDIELFSKQSETLFGAVDIGSLIELSVLAVCMLDENKQVTGFLALEDHPNIPGLDPAEWEIWIRNMFQKFFLSRNTLFIHYMCCIDSVVGYFLEEALLSVFQNDSYLLHIVLVTPAGCPANEIKKFQNGRKFLMYQLCATQRREDCDKYYMYVALRQDFCPKLKVRRAVEEDNEDVVEILDKLCPRLKKLYGDYYISEIIGDQSQKQRKIIVAAQLDKAVGVMCLNSDVNYEMLQRTYELRPYYGLLKVKPLMKEELKRKNSNLRNFGNPIMTGKYSPFQTALQTTEQLHLLHSKENLMDEISKENITISPLLSSRVNYAEKRKSIILPDIVLSESASEDSTDYSVMFSSIESLYPIMMDEEPFDYDIVNIDSKLFAPPSTLSYGNMLFHVESKPKSKGSYDFYETPNRTNLRQRRMSIKICDEGEVYNGDPNAFMIELFGLCESIDERHAVDLLEAAFEVMKSYDYCIIRIPCAEKWCSLLQHFCFVPTKNQVSCDYALYVAHRSSFLGKIRVRRAEIIDIPQIANMLQRLEVKETIYMIEESIINNGPLHAYVFMCGVSVVGIGILEETQELDVIMAKYSLNSFCLHNYQYKGQGCNAGFATLKTTLAYPVFEVHFRFFAREMMRLSGYYSLIWMTTYRSKHTTNKINILESAMIPMMPRLSDIDCTDTPELKETSDLLNNVIPFSAWYLGRKQTSIPKVNVDARIVIVGASRTALGFLDSLLFTDSSSYLTFTNVTIVSRNGMRCTRHAKNLHEMMFPKNLTKSDKYLRSVPYSHYVNVIPETMVEINKQQKYIKLSNETKCHYDLLFLMFGKQFQHPDYYKLLEEKEKATEYGNLRLYSTNVDVNSSKCSDIDSFNVNCYETPDNVFIVNNISDASKALSYINRLVTLPRSYKILIYGCSLPAYCCLTTLLEMNVPPQNIVFIEPFPPEDHTITRIPVFCNPDVDKTVRRVIQSLNVTVYSSSYFQSWSVDDDNLVTYVEILSNFKLIRLECSAFFYYGQRGFDIQALLAVHNCGIAFDNGIMVDHEFKTSAPGIHAAGYVTNYYRRYGAENKRQKYFDSYEVGSKLGDQIRNQLDPLFNAHHKDSNNVHSENVNFDDATSGMTNAVGGPRRKSGDSNTSWKAQDMKLPQFKRPLVVSCTLPGGLRYLNVRPPGVKLSSHYVQSLEFNGIVMKTFKNGYFKLHLTKDQIVDGITCLSTEKYPISIFARLYGLSSSALNYVYLRFTTKKIDDFYTFFRAPWAAFLYHDRVQELVALVKELLPMGQQKGQTLSETLNSMCRDRRISEQSTKFGGIYEQAFDKVDYMEAISNYVVQWITENKTLLPMYMHPGCIVEFTHDINRHAAFKNAVKKEETD